MAGLAFIWQKLLNPPMQVTEVRYLGAGRLLPDPRWEMKPHAHDIHELICVVRGRLVLDACARRHLCAPGDVLLYPAGVVHAERSDPDDPLESVFLSFSCPAIRERDIVRSFDHRGRISLMARWLYDDRLASDAEARMQRGLLMRSILAELGRDATSRDRQLVEGIRQFVHDHIGEKLTLSDLAGAAGLSKYHFLRRYRDAAGRTPMEDVRAIRVAYARELLLSTNMRMKEIAPRAGLGDQYAMSRQFHRLLGVSPRRLRSFHA